MLLPGVPGVGKGNVVILGGGNVGTNARKTDPGLLEGLNCYDGKYTYAAVAAARPM